MTPTSNSPRSRESFLRWPLAALLLASVLSVSACHEQPPVQAVVKKPEAVTSGDRSGAISRPSTGGQPLAADVLAGTKWPPARVRGGSASVSCDPDYDATGDGVPLVNLEFFSVIDAMSACREAGVVRLRYRGKIDADFTALVQRVAAMADRMDIGKRILDIDSPGGIVEDAIRAGDAMGAAHWTIWVRNDAVCHSACVLILAAGDNRVISGKVGIHRIIRMSSTASSRAQLSRELGAVHGQIKDYLARNGSDVDVADLMMTVPSSDLRLLSGDDLQQFGLSGSNAVEDDLERIRLLRKCGEDFVHRKERFAREFNQQCNAPGDDIDAINACGRALRGKFGLPDRRCPDESPLSEYD